MEVRKTGENLPKLTDFKKEEKVKKTQEVKDEVKIKEKGVLKKTKEWIKKNIMGGPQLSSVYDESVSDYRDKTGLYAAAGATAGGAVGTFIGMMAGLEQARNEKVEKVWVQHEIKDPKLVGYYHRVYESGHWERYISGYDSDGDPIYSERYVVDGYWHRFYPDIKEKTVGTYQTPEYRHGSWLNPLTGGLVGLIGGAVVGAVLGVVINLARKAIKGE